MREFINRITRPCRKITDNIIIATVLSLVIMVLGSILSGIMLNLTGFRTFLSNYLQNDNLEMFLSSYLEFIGIWIAVLIFTAVPKSNRPMLKSFWHNRNGNNLKGILAGILLGFGTNSFCVLMSWLSGNIKFSYYGFEPVILLMFIAAIFIQSGAEELMDRTERWTAPLYILFFVLSGAELDFGVIADLAHGDVRQGLVAHEVDKRLRQVLQRSFLA